MRFTATLTNCELLIKLVQTMDKIGKKCIIHLTPDRVLFIFSKRGPQDDMHLWVGVTSPSALFGTYTIDSLNNNEIGFEVSLDNLLRALKSGHNAGEIVTKLSKRDNQPVFRTVITTGGERGRLIQQDVPIEILSAGQLASFCEPQLADPTVYIMLPPLKLLRSVIDRMKNINDYLIITADMGGNLSLTVETEQVSAATFYKNLSHPQIEGRPPPTLDCGIHATIKVDIKKFARVLYSYQVEPTNVILCIVEDAAVVIHVILDNMYLTYYIPVVIS